MTRVRNVSRTLNPPTITTRNWGGARAAGTADRPRWPGAGVGPKTRGGRSPPRSVPPCNTPRARNLVPAQAAALAELSTWGNTLHNEHGLSGLRNEQTNYEAAPPWAGQAALLPLELGPEC